MVFFEEEPYLSGRPIYGTAVSHWWNTVLPLVGHGFATGGKTLRSLLCRTSSHYEITRASGAGES